MQTIQAVCIQLEKDFALRETGSSFSFSVLWAGEEVKPN